MLWPRIDQKTCLKSIQASGFEPLVIPMRLVGDQLETDLAALAAQMERLGRAGVAAVVTTTSCFAPRAADDVVAGAAGQQGPHGRCTAGQRRRGAAGRRGRAPLRARRGAAARACACDALAQPACCGTALTHGPPSRAAVAKLCQQAGIRHVINNAYGVQSAELCAQVRAVSRLQLAPARHEKHARSSCWLASTQCPLSCAPCTHAHRQARLT